MKLGRENPHFGPPKYPKIQYFTNNGLSQNWCKPYIIMFLQIMRIFWYYLYKTILKSYGPRFGPPTYPKILQYYTNNGPEIPQNWCKPYISMFLHIIRIFWYYLYKTIPKSYGARTRKSPFWTLKIPQIAIFQK